MKPKKELFNHRPALFLPLFWGLAAFFLFLIGKNTYSTFNTGTDENRFGSSNSQLYVLKEVPAEKVVNIKRRYLHFRKRNLDHIRRGDLVIAINGISIRTASEAYEILSHIGPLDRVSIEVQRTNRLNYFLEFEIRADHIPGQFIWEIPATVYAWHVPAGRASHSAGMKRGDLIYTINGRTFASAKEADHLVKNTLRGQTVDYGIIRNGRFATLQITMARLTIPSALILYYLVGLATIIGALSLILFRSHLKAARLLGTGLFLLGLSFLLFQDRARTFNAFFPEGYRLLTWLTFQFGIATLLHTSYYFPRERSRMLKTSLWRYQSYLVAGLTVPICFWLGLKSLIFALAALFIPHIYFRYKIRRKNTHEYRHQERYIIYGMLIALGTMILWFPFKNRLPDTWDLTVRSLAPLALLAGYVMTIARFRLLGIQIRRNLQYSLINFCWLIILACVFFWGLRWLSHSELPLYNINLTLSNIEFHDSPASLEERSANEKFLLMVFAILFGYLLYKTGRAGNRLLRRKFHRISYDYQSANREMAQLMTAKLDLQELAKGIVGKLARLMMLRQVGIVFFRDKTIASTAEALGSYGEQWRNLCSRQGHYLAEIMQKFKTELCVDYLTPSLKKPLMECGFEYIYAILSKNELVGCLLIGGKLSESSYHQEDFRFLSATAQQAAVAIEQAFLYERLEEQARLKHELALARRIQLASLPQEEPEIEGLDLAAISEPALEVGGDYYAYFYENTEALTLIVADVSGKGTSAALYMSKIQGIFSSLHSNGLRPKELFIKANPILFREMDRSSFVTAVCAQFETKPRRLRLARAGHIPILVFRAKTGQTESHLPPGIGLGLENGGIFNKVMEELTLDYEPGDVFLFLSDGLTETMNREKNTYGEDEVLRVLAEHSGNSSREIRDAIMEHASIFGEGLEQHDDQTLVVVKAC